MAKIKKSYASPNHLEFWKEKKSLALTAAIYLLQMSTNCPNVNYSTN